MDITTSLIFVEILTIVNSIAAFLLWRVHRQLRGLASVSVGCLILAVAFILHGVRTPVAITIANTAMVLAIGMVAEGMLVLAGGRPLRWLVPALAVFTLLLWTAMLWLVPDNVPLRVAVASLIYIGFYLRLLWSGMRHAGRFSAARTCMVVSLWTHIGVLVARMVAALVHPDPNFVFSPAVLPWFMLEGVVVMNLTFFSVMMMVGTRLDEDLKERTHSLMAERRMHGQLRQFLSMLGHELRTPLAIIDRSAELSLELLDRPRGPVAQRLDTIRTTVERARSLMDNLLTAERAELASAHGDLVDISQVVRDLTRVLGQKYADGRILADLPPTSPLVRGDREMLAVAIGNLLDNALKFSAPDQAVQIGLQDGGMVTVTVRDSGIGFPPQQIAQIGQRFFRAGNTGAIPGTGLGMSIVKAVVDRHDGRLELHNRPEGGAVVTLTLPHAEMKARRPG
ncbi:sensor histidine kinase KdpD [Niveispirillum sp.]|uniref:sensor histidine kinase n=1 Tax=Niveispirillum sp. TaxID=1917217 RepID=UPI001B3F98D1|nr:HAMP domain-containing sensor histidine kinase [Niveispirillum sp.]MBP7335500.1 HAMP domain-containing histidine kinase [Niveispirillum sp.]